MLVIVFNGNCAAHHKMPSPIMFNMESCGFERSLN